MAASSSKSLTGEISIRLYANLARYAGGKIGFFTMLISSSETLIDIIQRLRIPLTEVSLIFVNGCATSNLDTPIKSGDEIQFLGLVDGG